MIEREIRTFILRALLAAHGQPMTDDALKGAILNSFRHVAFTSHDLSEHIKDCERLALIAGTADEVEGLVWALTLKGKTRAQQLP
jgi:hypothetical protein